MKVCPHCDQSFQDETLNFCLTDGTPLLAGESQPTIMMPESGQITATAATIHVKKKKTGVWIGLGALVLLIGIVGLSGLLYLAYRMGGQQATVDKPANVSSVATPKPAATPKPSVTQTPTSSPITTPTPVSGETKPSSDDDDNRSDDSDETVPITWTTSGATFKTDAGRTYTFECPAGGSESAVWGSDVYTADSSICTAAVHAGKIKLSTGGTVTIEMRPGRQMYGSTTRNGITSNPFGEFQHSFVVR